MNVCGLMRRPWCAWVAEADKGEDNAERKRDERREAEEERREGKLRDREMMMGRKREMGGVIFMAFR